MSGHLILMAVILIAPHLKERYAQSASLFCLCVAALVLVLK